MIGRVILHLDMDAFFASVEQRDDQRLLNRPIAVAGSSKRTVLVSPSYEARAYGVKTGMTKATARSLCPDIIFVTSNTDKYVLACRKIIKILYKFTPDIEVYSIDEFFLDITETMHLFGNRKHIAKKMKDEISRQLSLSCSIGISHNKLMAKLGSEHAKPGGIYLIRKADLPGALDDMAVDVLCGIGSKTKACLAALGISTLKQLRTHSVSDLKKRFGVNGPRLHLMASGIDDSLVVPMGCEEEAKSIGHSMTFPRDTSNPAILNRYMLELSDKVARRLRKAGLSAKAIKVTIRYKSFKTFSRQKSLEAASDDTKSIYHSALRLLGSIQLKEPVRLLGVSVLKLTTDNAGSSLFEEGKRKYKLNRLLDYTNERFGQSVVSFASLLTPADHKRIISPAWRPYGKRN